MTLELYHFDKSTCSQKVRICLAEKELDWVNRRVDLPGGEHLTPAYLALNPNGVVPTLVHDGEPMTIADICMVPLLQRMEDLGMAQMWTSDRSRVSDWYDRIRARPAYQTAFYPGSLLAD